MLVCVDTSGSMQGGAEAVAKAVVLEAVRTAHAQTPRLPPVRVRRPGGDRRTDARRGRAGIGALVDSWARPSTAAPTSAGRSNARWTSWCRSAWQLADLLIASDGEFGATPQTALAIARAKAEQGLRVQGVLIGDRETIGFLEIADDIYWVRDWRRYGGYDVDSPVPTKSLTAIYFPGALRSAGHHATSRDDAGPQTKSPPVAAGPT